MGIWLFLAAWAALSVVVALLLGRALGQLGKDDDG